MGAHPFLPIIIESTKNETSAGLTLFVVFFPRRPGGFQDLESAAAVLATRRSCPASRTKAQLKKTDAKVIHVPLESIDAPRSQEYVKSGIPGCRADRPAEGDKRPSRRRAGCHKGQDNKDKDVGGNAAQDIEMKLLRLESAQAEVAQQVGLVAEYVLP